MNPDQIIEAAREYIQARATGIPWPAVVQARERLRVALGEPEPPAPLTKPWEKYSFDV